MVGANAQVPVEEECKFVTVGEERTHNEEFEAKGTEIRGRQVIIFWSLDWLRARYSRRGAEEVWSMRAKAVPSPVEEGVWEALRVHGRVRRASGRPKKGRTRRKEGGRSTGDPLPLYTRNPDDGEHFSWARAGLLRLR